MYHSEITIQQWRELKGFINMPGSNVRINGDSLTIAQAIYIARYSGKVIVHNEAYSKLEESSNALRARLDRGEVIYGVNTGFGASADLRNSDMEMLQQVLTRELCYGILSPTQKSRIADTLTHRPSSAVYDLSLDTREGHHYLPWTWVRAAIAIRINSLIKGYSGIRPVIIQRLLDLLDHDIIPMIPLRGSISASGDLSPLAYISGAIQGKPSIRILTKETSDSDLRANEALLMSNLEPVSLQAKEGLAIVNGTAVSTAVGLSVVYDAHGLAVLAQMLTAMSVECLLGTSESFHPFFGESRPHPGQVESARNILSFLRGSALVEDNDGSNGSLRQDRYSIRTAPQWIGPALEDLVLAHQQVVVECNSATDNPLIADGLALHGGNFQAKSITSAMEKIRQALHSLGRMIFVQCTEIINPSTSKGLPVNLVAEDPNRSGIFKGVDIQIAALQSELGYLANPVHSIQSAEGGNQSLNSLALISARYTSTCIEILSEMAAAHLLTVCQAVDLRAMNLDFLKMYRSPFLEVISQFCGRQFQEPETASQSIKEDSWNQFVKAFNITASLGAEDRCQCVADSFRLFFIDHVVSNQTPDPLRATEDLRKSLQQSLRATWPAYRDAYMVHGDATQYLGAASKRLYQFVRQDLHVPFLTTAQIRTPKTAGGLSVDGVHTSTVGQYTTVLYRAIRDGTMAVVMHEIMTDVLENGA